MYLNDGFVTGVCRLWWKFPISTPVLKYLLSIVFKHLGTNSPQRKGFSVSPSHVFYVHLIEEAYSIGSSAYPFLRGTLKNRIRWKNKLLKKRLIKVWKPELGDMLRWDIWSTSIVFHKLQNLPHHSTKLFV